MRTKYVCGGEGGEDAQTGDALFTMTGWRREGRGRGVWRRGVGVHGFVSVEDTQRAEMECLI